MGSGQILTVNNDLIFSLAQRYVKKCKLYLDGVGSTVNVKKMALYIT